MLRKKSTPLFANSSSSCTGLFRPKKSLADQEITRDLSTKPASFMRYLNLPLDVLGHLSTFFDQRDLVHVNQARGRIILDEDSSASCSSDSLTTKQKYNYRHFKLYPAVSRLLQAVGFADYTIAKKIVEQDSSLIFRQVNFTYSDGSTDFISPLKYAFKVFDTYMWKMFYEKIKENTDFKLEFLKQALSEAKPIDRVAIFAAYETYLTHYKSYQQGAMSASELRNKWLEFGKAQKSLIPVHMLKEFIRQGNTWRTDSTFDVCTIPAPDEGRVYDLVESKGWISCNSILENQSWGSSELGWYKSFALVRSHTGTCTVASHGYANGQFGRSLFQGIANSLRSDLAIFHRLFEVRMNDLNHFIDGITRSNGDNKDQTYTKADNLLSSRSSNSSTAF